MVGFEHNALRVRYYDAVAGVEGNGCDTQISLGLSALGDIPHKGTKLNAVRGVAARDRQLNGELVAIAVQALHFNPCVENHTLFRAHKPGHALLVALAVACGNDGLVQGAANGLFTTPAKSRLRVWAPARDAPTAVGLNDGIQRRVDD